MNHQDFITVLEDSHHTGKNIESELLWDEKAEKFAAMKKTYGTQLTDKVLLYLKERGILNKNTSVLDIGCGAGRYAVPFASACSSVTAADISGKMLALVQEEAVQHGLDNIATVKSDWRDLTDRHDLVFASMSPVIFCYEGLQKMSSLSNKFCVVARYINIHDTIVEAIEGEEHKNNPHKGRDAAWAIFNLLWMDGYQPEITYLDRICDAPLTMEEAQARYHMQEEDKELLFKKLQPFINSDGMVDARNKSTLALIIWNTNKTLQ